MQYRLLSVTQRLNLLKHFRAIPQFERSVRIRVPAAPSLTFFRHNKRLGQEKIRPRPSRAVGHIGQS